GRRCGVPRLDGRADAGEADADGLGRARLPDLRHRARLVGQEADLGTGDAQAAQGLNLADIKALIRTVPDFPAEGIQFRDITTLIADGPGLAATLDHLVERARKAEAATVAGIEARGFI